MIKNKKKIKKYHTANVLQSVSDRCLKPSEQLQFAALIQRRV
jgi:hypothetical protein